MGEPAATPDRTIVADAIAVALAHSRLAETIDRDALDAIAHFEAAQLVHDGHVDLQAAWRILAELPGFDPTAARGPFVVLESWQPQLGAPVIMPAELAQLSERDRALARTECAPPAGEVRRAFETAEERAARQAALAEATAPAAVEIGEIAPTWKTRAEVAYAAIGVLVVALGAIGFTLYRYLNVSPDWTGIEATSFASGIPLKDAQVFGTQVGATLSDDAWLALDKDQRAAQLEEAFRRVPLDDATVLFVNDSRGKMRGSAQWYGTPPQVRIRWY
jgi:hypothetical protein